MFFSKELAEAYQKSKEHLESFVHDITHISKDMRFLELLLKNYVINFPFECLFTYEILKPGTGDNPSLIMHIYEFVAWEVNEKEKRRPSFRLFYKRYEAYLEEEDLSDFLPPSAKMMESRPLVETPLRTRLKIYPFLPIFLEKLTEELCRQKYELNFTRFSLSIKEFEKTLKAKFAKKQPD